MAKTILEALIEEQPKGFSARNESLDIAYALVNLHMDEIEEARQHGYSWMQIEDACKELWKTNPKSSKIIWSKTKMLIMRCYQAIKKGRKPHYVLAPTNMNTKNASKKYNIEVTEA